MEKNRQQVSREKTSTGWYAFAEVLYDTGSRYVDSGRSSIGFNTRSKIFIC